MLDRKIAYIDLSTGEVRKEAIPEKMRRLYLGGRGLDMYLLYNQIESGTDPLSPENVLLMSAGLLSGSLAPGSGRTHVGAKSPLTGLVGSTNMGGFVSPELRLAGFDHLVIKGRCEKPSYLWIHDGEIEVRDAAHLWGRDTLETPAMIREELGDPDIKVMCIGVAGEKLVKFANVRTGLKNAGGRTGMGCVMGSKNLKAVAIRGTMDLKVRYPEKALAYYRELQDQILSSKAAQAYGVEGTMVMYSTSNTTGFLRTKNFGLNRMDDLSIVPDTFLEKYSFGVTACYGCSVHCRHKWRINDGPYAGLLGEGPEYFTTGAFGNMVNNKSWVALLRAQYLLDKEGLDLAESGNLIAWAMDLYNRGIIDKVDTHGLDLGWDNASQVVPELLEKIACREGLGDTLADGPRLAVEKIGRGSEFYMLQVKGMGQLLSDDRSTPALALGIATATRGADHLRSRPAIDLYGLPEDVLEKTYGFPVSGDYGSYFGKARMVHFQELIYELVDSLGICKFQTIFFSPHMPKFEEYSKLVYYETGLEISPEELKEIAERAYTLERMFNYREKGITREDDRVATDRYFTEETPSGVSRARGKKLDREKFEKMLDEYYEDHGWDLGGVPKPETLAKLGLDNEPSHML